VAPAAEQTADVKVTSLEPAVNALSLSRIAEAKMRVMLNLKHITFYCARPTPSYEMGE
jgi:hypothetical protein